MQKVVKDQIMSIYSTVKSTTSTHNSINLNKFASSVSRSNNLDEDVNQLDLKKFDFKSNQIKFNKELNYVEHESDTLIDILRQCYLPAAAAAAVSSLSSPNSNEQNIKNNLLFAANSAATAAAFAVASNKLYNEQKQKTSLNKTLSSSARLAKEHPTYANFSIEAILTNQRKNLTHLVNLDQNSFKNEFNTSNLDDFHKICYENNLNEKPNLNLGNYFTNSNQAHPNLITQSTLIQNNNFNLFNLNTTNQLCSKVNQLNATHSNLSSNLTLTSNNSLTTNKTLQAKYADETNDNKQILNSQLLPNGGQISKLKLSRKKCFNRGPRIPFSGEQICILEKKFKENHYLSSFEVVNLSEQLNLTEARVKIWFQNRRARLKREQKPK